MTLLLSTGLGDRILGPTLVLRCRVLPRHDIDEEVEHVGLAERGCYVTALQGATFVLLRMDPRTHGELGDEGLARFGEDYGCLSRDHLDFGVGLHDLLDARERELVDLVVVVFRLEHGHDLLPVGVEDVAVVA